MIFTDREIRELDIIKNPATSIAGQISYGFSSFGYDLRLDSNVKLFTDVDEYIDPKNFTAKSLKTIGVTSGLNTKTNNSEQYVVLPAYGYCLGNSVELIEMPENVFGLCVGKSTYARSGIIVNTTPLEPGWKGHLTIEISNATGRDIKLYVNEGIAQVSFFKGNRPMITYADRNGKYQNQERKPVMPKI